MNAQIRAAVEETTQTVSSGRELFLNTTEATRYYTLAVGFAELAKPPRHSKM
jgi:hypothetical protein